MVTGAEPCQVQRGSTCWRLTGHGSTPLRHTFTPSTLADRPVTVEDMMELKSLTPYPHTFTLEGRPRDRRSPCDCGGHDGAQVHNTCDQRGHAPVPPTASPDQVSSACTIFQSSIVMNISSLIDR